MTSNLKKGSIGLSKIGSIGKERTSFLQTKKLSLVDNLNFSSTGRGSGKSSFNAASGYRSPHLTDKLSPRDSNFMGSISSSVLSATNKKRSEK